jgi:AcrR family transcriptional regulator
MKKRYHHGDLPRALVKAAVELVAEHGAEQVTLRQVAAAAGVDHSAVYRHFADKRALFAAVAEDGFQRLADAMAKAVGEAREGVDGKLRALGRAYVRFGLEHAGRFAVMFGPRLNTDGRFPSLEEALQRAMAVAVAVTAEGVAAGRYHGRPLDVAVSVWSLSHGFVSLAAVGKIRVRDRKEYFERQLALLLSGLRR